jgi:hypothetical protein
MAQRDTTDKSRLFIKRARHFNLSFIGGITVLFVASLATYSYFSMPVTSRLILYVYLILLLSGVLSYAVAFAVRKKMFPVSRDDPYWSYTAVRRYFWSYVLLSVPFFLSFIFFLFAGNLSALLLGYFLSLCGLIIFRPKEGDVL